MKSFKDFLKETSAKHWLKSKGKVSKDIFPEGGEGVGMDSPWPAAKSASYLTRSFGSMAQPLATGTPERSLSQHEPSMNIIDRRTQPAPMSAYKKAMYGFEGGKKKPKSKP